MDINLERNNLEKDFPELNLGLTEIERDVLAYYAIADGNSNLSDILKMRLCNTAAERDRVISDLLDNRYLTYDYRSWHRNEYQVRNRFFVPVMTDLLLYHKDLVSKIEKGMGKRAKSDRRRIIDDIVNGTKTYIGHFDPDLIYPLSDNDCFAPVIGKKSFSPIFKRMSNDMLKRLAYIYFDQWLTDNKHPVASLDALDFFADAYMKDKGANVHGMADCYRYFLTGTVSPLMSAETEWYDAVTAIKFLYAGKYQEALAAFESYLKMRNKTHKVKNIADSPIISYYLVMCYLLENSEKSQKKLEQFRNKDLERMDYYNQVTGRFLAVISGGLENEDIKRMSENIYKSPDNFDCAKELVWGICASRDIKTSLDKFSDFAIIRHETSSFSGIATEVAANLARTFGGNPLIGRFRIREPWEALLKSLENSTSDVGADNAVESKTSRLIYITENYRNILRPKLQSVSKSGKWTAGRFLPLSSLKSGMYDDVFDETDKAVLKTSDYYDIFISDAMPYLIGSDRVFHDSFAPENQVTIREELPFLKLDFDKKIGRYVFSTNAVSSRYDGKYLAESVIRKSKFEYVVIRLTGAQIRLLTQIHTMNTGFPVSAESALRELLPRLGKIIEVHSTLLESGSSLQDKDGNAMLFFRVIPHGQTFLTTLYVRPLNGGQCTFWPGNGGAEIYDSDQTGRYHVIRNLKFENSVLKEFLAASGLDLADDVDGQYELTAGELLTAIQAAKEMPDRVNVEWPEGRSLKVAGKLSPEKFHVNVHSRENWFEVEGNAESSEGVKFTLDQILAAIAAGGYDSGFLKLGEDEYVELSDSLAKYVKRLESITSGSHGKVSVFQTGLLADILQKSHVEADIDNKVTDTLDKMKEATAMEPTVPSGLKAELRDYQEVGYKWMVRLDHWGAGACLADDMGLGKTVQTIAFLLFKADKGASLVVAPASVVMNWQRELQRFAPSLDIVILNEAGDRSHALESIGKFTVVLTTYGLLAKEQELLSGIDWNVVCLDEAHTIKNRDTKMSGAAMSLRASSRIILTGTPVQNYLGELWNLFQFINPGLLGNYDSFARKFIMPIEQLQDKDRQSQLKRIIQPFMLRRTKAEVVEELPDKTEIMRSVALTPAETVAYETMRLAAKKELENESMVNVNALAAITRLREAACAMQLVKKGWKDEPSKVTALLELVQEIISGNNGVLVFSQFTGFLDIVSSALTETGIGHLYLKGATPMKKRQEMVLDFQHGKSQVFLISLKAGGLGLNLTGANYVIHLDPWWNPAIEQQATDRAYRIGQQQNVTVYHLIAQGTIEEKIIRMHKAKQNLADAILEGTSSSHAITIDELRELLK